MRGVGKVLRTVGRGMQYLGGGMLFLAAVIGTLVADLLILALFLGSLGKASGLRLGFCTGLILGLVWGDRHSTRRHTSRGDSVASLMVSSVVMSAIGIGLAICFGLPHLAFFLAALWVVSGAVLMIGFAVEKLGDDLAGSSNYTVHRAPQPAVVIHSHPYEHAPQAQVVHQHQHQHQHQYPYSSYGGAQASLGVPVAANASTHTAPPLYAGTYGRPHPAGVGPCTVLPPNEQQSGCATAPPPSTYNPYHRKTL